jgi:hypothetical protein
MPPGAFPFFFSQHFSVDSVQVEFVLLFVVKANNRPEPIISVAAINMMFFFFMSLDFLPEQGWLMPAFRYAGFLISSAKYDDRFKYFVTTNLNYLLTRCNQFLAWRVFLATKCGKQRVNCRAQSPVFSRQSAIWCLYPVSGIQYPSFIFVAKYCQL